MQKQLFYHLHSSVLLEAGSEEKKKKKKHFRSKAKEINIAKLQSKTLSAQTFHKRCKHSNYLHATTIQTVSKKSWNWYTNNHCDFLLEKMFR